MLFLKQPVYPFNAVLFNSILRLMKKKKMKLIQKYAINISKFITNARDHGLGSSGTFTCGFLAHASASQSHGFFKAPSGRYNWYFEKLKTLYYHKITHRIHFWKNPEKYRVRIFSGIRIFPEFFAPCYPEWSKDSEKPNLIKICWEL